MNHAHNKELIDLLRMTSERLSQVSASLNPFDFTVSSKKMFVPAHLQPNSQGHEPSHKHQGASFG
jgi:hypothetical protein